MGILKANIIEAKYEVELKLPGGGGGEERVQNKKTFCGGGGGGMDSFWNCTLLA